MHSLGYYGAPTAASTISVGVSQVIESTTGDVALLRLSRYISYSREISPVCLTEQGEEFPDWYWCYTTGWGTLSCK